MANGLDEMRDATLKEGRDVNVIGKQLPVTIGFESTLYEICIWVLPILIGAAVGYFVFMPQYGIAAVVVGAIAGIIPGILYAISKVKAAEYLDKLQQKLQHDASQIDNYLEQRVVILKNAAKLLEKAIDLDKDTFTTIAGLRSGSLSGGNADEARNNLQNEVDKAYRNINVAVENYPDLKAHQEIEDVLQQNSYLQKEITAAREVYNDTVLKWNSQIYTWPAKRIVAAKKGYTTRIPFATSEEIKKEAREVLF